MDLESIKCAICRNYLSYFPVVIAGDAFQNVCGRCCLLTKTNIHARNKAYENVAQFVDFPCSYAKKGCAEKLPPRDIPNHEELCSYKIITCPVRKSTHCDWKDSRSSLVDHIEDEHYDIVLENGEFEIDLSKSHQSENFFIHTNVAFLVMAKYDSVTSNLQFSITHTDNSTSEYSYKACFENDTNSVSVDGCVISLNETNEGNPSKISLKSLKAQGKKILAKSKLEEIQVVKVDPAIRRKINKRLLSQLECSECSHYVLPPIYEDNHGVITCSECRKAKTRIQNLTLDNIANLLLYPCKYHRNGCIFVSKPEQMRQHHDICPLRDLECPVKDYVKCKWKGARKEMPRHISRDHQSTIRDNSVISEQVRKSQNWYCYIMRFSERLYRLSFAIINQYYCWEMQMIESSEGHFKYGIEIFNKNYNQHKRLVAEQTGSILTNHDGVFEDKNRCFMIHGFDVEDFLSRGKEISFRVYIIR